MEKLLEDYPMMDYNEEDITVLRNLESNFPRYVRLKKAVTPVFPGVTVFGRCCEK